MNFFEPPSYQHQGEILIGPGWVRSWSVTALLSLIRHTSKREITITIAPERGNFHPLSLEVVVGHIWLPLQRDIATHHTHETNNLGATMSRLNLG